LSETNDITTARVRFGFASLGLLAIVLSGCESFSDYVKDLTRTTKNCPIVVRGGAMTAFTTNEGGKNGWYPKPPLTSAITEYCVDTETAKSYIEVTYQSGVGTKIASFKKLPPTWTVEIKSQDDEGASLIFAPHPKGCNSAGTSITVTSTKHSHFYTTVLAPGADHSDNRRFQSVACSSTDMDKCERMGEIDVTLKVGDKPVPFQCPDGDCYVRIGPLQVPQH
jgi:hypothetical protein